MRIVVNDIAASSGGALTILQDFYNFLLSNSEAKKHEWIFLLSDNLIDETENIKVHIHKDKKRWTNKLIFECITGRNYIKELKPDKVFSLQNTIIYGTGYPQIVYLHQSLPFQDIKKFSFFSKNEAKLALYQHIIGKYINFSIRKADLVVVQTKWMKEAISEKSKINGTKIINVLPKIVMKYDTKTDVVFNPNSFFYPATKEIYKNHDCIIKAITILNKEGINDFSVKLTLNKLINTKNIDCIGHLNSEDMEQFYRSSVLVFPSYIETIGLPLLEARSVGSIILAAKTKFASEALENYENAYFFDPFRPNELAALMKSIINSEIRLKKTNIADSSDKSSWEKLFDDILL